MDVDCEVLEVEVLVDVENDVEVLCDVEVELVLVDWEVLDVLVD